jgi:hypothetical protein
MIIRSSFAAISGKDEVMSKFNINVGEEFPVDENPDPPGAHGPCDDGGGRHRLWRHRHGPARTFLAMAVLAALLTLAFSHPLTMILLVLAPWAVWFAVRPLIRQFWLSGAWRRYPAAAEWLAWATLVHHAHHRRREGGQ